MSVVSAWKTSKLPHLAEIQYGCPFDSNLFNSTDGMPLIRIRDLKRGTSTEALYSGSYEQDYVVNGGDILIGMDGEFRAYKWNGEAALLNQRVCRIRKFATAIEPDFIFYQLDQHLKRIEDATPFATVKHLSAKQLKEVCIAYPDLDTQRRIVARIKDCFSRLEEMEQLQAAALKDSKRLPLNYFRHTYERLCQELPTRPLREIATVQGGGTPSRDRKDYWAGDIPWVSPKDMKVWNLMDAQEHVSPEGITGSAAKLIDPPAVLFVVRGMILAHTLPIAVTRVPVAINQDMKALIPRGMSADFLAAMLLGASALLLRQVEIAGHGTRRLQTEKWSDLPIPIPGKQESRLLAEFQSVREAASEMTAETAAPSINHLRTAILREAFAGRL